MKIDLKELGKRIKLTRKGQDLTQEMLAEKAGVSQHYIYEIEAGRKAMSIHSFASLTTALDVSADYLLFGDGQRIFDVDTPAHHNNHPRPATAGRRPGTAVPGSTERGRHRTLTAAPDPLPPRPAGPAAACCLRSCHAAAGTRRKLPSCPPTRPVLASSHPRR